MKQTISKISFHSFGDLGPHFFLFKSSNSIFVQIYAMWSFTCWKEENHSPKIFDTKKIRYAHWPSRTEAANYSILVNLSDMALS